MLCIAGLSRTIPGMRRRFSISWHRTPIQIVIPLCCLTLSLPIPASLICGRGEPFRVHVTVINRFKMQQWLTLTWHLPEGISVSPAASVSGSLESYYCNLGRAEFDFELTAEQLQQSRYDLLLDVQSLATIPAGWCRWCCMPPAPCPARNTGVLCRDGRKRFSCAGMIESLRRVWYTLHLQTDRFRCGDSMLEKRSELRACI